MTHSDRWFLLGCVGLIVTMLGQTKNAQDFGFYMTIGGFLGSWMASYDRQARK